MSNEKQDPTAGHSPLPWSYDARSNSVWWDPHYGALLHYGADANGDGGVEIGPILDEADAALIVREVNAGPKLRAENARLRAQVEQMSALLLQGMSLVSDATFGTHDHQWIARVEAWTDALQALVEDARAAALAPQEAPK